MSDLNGGARTALDNSVFPVPEGPVNRREATGLLTLPKPVRASWMAFATAWTA